MAKIVARNAALWVDSASLAAGDSNSISLSGKTNTATLTFSAEAPEVTTFGEGMRTRVAGGLQDWNLSIGGFSDMVTGQVNGILFSLLGASTRIRFGPGGSTAGCTLYVASAICTDYSVDSSVEGAVGFGATFTNLSSCMVASTW